MTAETTHPDEEPQDEPVKESQVEPEEDSGLQTPQPDQPFPTEEERQEKSERNQAAADSPPVSSTRADRPIPSPPVDASYNR